MGDPDFGVISHHIDAWDGETDFDRPVSGTKRLRVHVRAGIGGPTEQQRYLIRELKRRYDSLWPKIADSIVALRPSAGDVARLPALLSPTLGVGIPGLIGDRLVDFVLTYEFKGDQSRSGYFVSFVAWRIERFDEAI